MSLDTIISRSKLYSKMQWIAAFFLLTLIAILVRFAGNKLIPVAMPQGLRDTIAFGWGGGLLGSLVDGATCQIGPSIVGINLAAAVVGAVFLILLVGAVPFFRIMLGRT